MMRVDCIDSQGCAYKSAATPYRWGDTSILMDSGISSKTIREKLNEESVRYEENAPWNRDHWDLQYRDPTEALEMLCADHLDCECVTGYSNFHHAVIDDNKICEIDEKICDDWNIDRTEIGSNFYQFPQDLGTTEKGDDGDMPKVFCVCH